LLNTPQSVKKSVKLYKMERIPHPQLSNPPILLVIAQVRFSSVLQMSKFIPEIQERLRTQGFPKFRPAQQQNLLIGPPGTPPANQSPTLLWEFLDRDDRKSLVVETGSVAFVVTDYSVFESFRDRLEIALSAISEVAKPSLRERIGLRYVNLVIPRPGKQVSDYIGAELQGMSPAQLSLKPVSYVSVMLSQSEVGTFVFRCTCPTQGPTIPPDVQLLGLKTDKPLSLGSEFCVLDFDHFTEKTKDFDVPAILSDFDQLHDLLDRSFRLAVKKEALQEWE
jgi:uncharacterized protein (TIGR04255 family)